MRKIDDRPYCDEPYVVGVDGCPSGWAVVSLPADGPLIPAFGLANSFAEIAERAVAPSVIAIDMPIGLPSHCGEGGRGPEKLIRPLLKDRQSSVFSIPSRQAVYAEDYGSACEIALRTSTPPRKVSKQAFNLFPKIREVDRYLRKTNHPPVFEVHPELAFWRFNGECAMSLPKKVKSRANPAGIDQRIALLVDQGIAADFFDTPRPRGVGDDDFVDATVCALMALRIFRGKAVPTPNPPLKDEHGIKIAIWS